jgi:hypothetical protein
MGMPGRCLANTAVIAGQVAGSSAGGLQRCVHGVFGTTAEALGQRVRPGVGTGTDVFDGVGRVQRQHDGGLCAGRHGDLDGHLTAVDVPAGLGQAEHGFVGGTGGGQPAAGLRRDREAPPAGGGAPQAARSSPYS